MGDTNRRYHRISVIRTAVHILALLTRTPLHFPHSTHANLLVTAEQGQKLPSEVCCRRLGCLLPGDDDDVAGHVKPSLVAPEDFAYVSFDAVTNDGLSYPLGDGHAESGTQRNFRQHIEDERRRDQLLATLEDTLVLCRLSQAFRGTQALITHAPCPVRRRQLSRYGSVRPSAAAAP